MINSDQKATLKYLCPVVLPIFFQKLKCYSRMNRFQLCIINALHNSYLCNQLGNALFCVTSGIFAGRAQRDPAKSHELHKIAFPKVLHTRFFLILTKKSFFKR
jgi:hypothetical protein